MSAKPVTIEKNPTLLPSEDYYFLRSKGIEFIEQMGSRHWTDYNSHDPGITLLEALCFAITDLGYKTGWNIEDLLAGPAGASQPFFTAKEILTCNHLTISDFRKILVDEKGIRNAWLICKDCACEVQLFADCENSRLAFEPPPQKPFDFDNEVDQETLRIAATKPPLSVIPLGTYDVLLELDQHPELGDLNDRKVFFRFNEKITQPGNPTRLEKVLLELHFPEWDEGLNGPFYHRDANNLLNFDDFTLSNINLIEVTKFSRSKTEGDPDFTQEELRKGWNGVFYVSLQVSFEDPITHVIKLVQLENVAMRIYGNEEVRRVMTPTNIAGKLMGFSGEGAIVKQYFRKQRAILEAVEEAKISLHEYRNLCEDWCCVSQVCVEDVAVCADVELAPDADVERVLANMLFEIETYFNPQVKFWSLQELLDEGAPVEGIFEGPSLVHGFIKTDELEAAQLKTVLRSSDIVNRLMDIEGVVAVKNLLLTKYDPDGNPVKGAADGGLDSKQISARWSLAIGERCQPRLHVPLSKFLFFKNDLPFLARTDEVQDTLNQIRGEAERLKIKKGPFDLPVAQGEFRSPEDYYPVQYSLPLTYGIGFDGLPDRASPQRRAQAKQLKSYLLFFEQLLANYLSQLANVGKLFSLDAAVTQTYFFRDLRDDEQIKDSEELMDAALDAPALQHSLVESQPEFLERRNRFLDHLLGRFAESFSDYALALYSYEDNLAHTQDKLIANKIAFLAEYPILSHDRARAMNYRKPPGAGNFPGLRKRIARLLGFDAMLEEKIIFVEHLLLRPKFSGDALMQVCLDKYCSGCGEEDPYSFQMTIVMPGWQEPFDSHLDMRRFADHTIRLETPAHILVKTCWVGNRGYELDPCDPDLKKLAELLVKNGKAVGGKRPGFEQACVCAEGVFKLFDEQFQLWIEGRKTAHNSASAVSAALDGFFKNVIRKNDLVVAACEVGLAALYNDLVAFMVSHFTDVTLHGFQYDKFRLAWENWLDANQKMDWCERGISRRLEMALEKLPGLKNDAKSCGCSLLAAFGTAFFARRKRFFDSPDAAKSLSNANEIRASFEEAFPAEKEFPNGVARCGALAFSEGEYSNLKELFVELYEDLFEVNHRLWILLDLLSKLNSVYPVATLHDCDDGSDINPVRLGSTALGG